MKKNLEQIAKEDSRYGISAIRFVYEGLGYTAKNVATEPKHVSGQTLCSGLRESTKKIYLRHRCRMKVSG